MPAVVAAFFRQMDELKLHKAQSNKRDLPRAGFSLLLSKIVAQAQRQKATIPHTTSDKGISQRAFAGAAMACSVKGVGAARIWYPRLSRPSPHDMLSFLRYGE
jgi:hypothetical protein